MNMFKQKRLAMKLSRKDVSKYTKLSVSTIKHMENNNHSPTLKNLIIYSSFLDISLDEYSKQYSKDNNIEVFKL